MMSSAILSVYHRLPSFAQSWAASLHGYRLRRWRYGPRTESLVQQALERDRWSPARLMAWRQERLASTLHRARLKVPYYRDYWSRLRQAGDRRSAELIENWPLLEKEQVRRSPLAFLADDCAPRRMYHDETSGTTGTPIRLWKSSQTLQAWYALTEARWRRWYGVSFDDRWAILGGKLVTPVERRHPPYWVWNEAFNQLYVSSYHLSAEAAPAILKAIEDYGVQYLVGYTASLNTLAQEARRLQTSAPLMRVAITNGEPVFGHQRASIEEAFSCRVRETYGMSEQVGAASECEHGALHLWPEAGWVEAIEGELIFTGLLNQDMPLIRYRVGDRGSLSESAACRCGRTLPTIGSLEGRIDDVLSTTDGRELSPNAVDIVFTADLPIKEAQIVQQSPTDMLVRVSPAAGWEPSVEAKLTRALRQRLGPVRVRFELLERIERGAGGKFKVVASAKPTSRRPPTSNGVF